MTKLPIGVMPRKLWLEFRIDELCRASEGRWDSIEIDEWLSELADLLKDYRRLYYEDQCKDR